MVEQVAVTRTGPEDGAVASSAALLDRIRESVIGDGAVLDGPYGPRRMTYADYTASGRPLAFVEDYLREQVMPLYANTHTESSGTGRQTTRLREDARAIIRDAVGGTEDHLVIFAGSGATAAVHKLVGILELRIPAGLDETYSLSAHVPAALRPVVFVGPYEHHSNELPWRESIAEVVEIGADADGRIDTAELEARLLEYADRPMRIGSFSAASNVTGILSDVGEISALLHRHGALSFWDYAAAAPYVPIRMTESAPGRGDGLDAIFCSPHKFVGGPQTPGVLVVDARLVRNRVPTVPGGGTVDFVNQTSHEYVADPVAREEGGTPAIIESVRAGLVFALKEAVGTELIGEREEALRLRAVRRWNANPNLDVLGNHDLPRLSIISFRIRVGSLWLHHNFVVALLNDLFGIQARGGCSCAGPYGHRLLAVDDERSDAFRDAIGHGCEGVKPGWARLNFHYLISDTVRDYLIEAVDLIAAYGHRLLGDYAFAPEEGLWQHRRGPNQRLHRLSEVTFDAAGLTSSPPPARLGEDALADHLAAARELLLSLPDVPCDEPTGLSSDVEALRWFPLPSRCLTPG